MRQKSLRNPIARDLRTPKYKQRVEAPKTAYKRKPKHPKQKETT